MGPVSGSPDEETNNQTNHQFSSTMPGTPASIETHYINSFRKGVEHAFQQQESLFEPYVEVVSQNAEEQYYDRLGVADDMQRDQIRYGTNPMSEIEWDRRRSVLEDWDWGKAIDPKDLKRIAEDPTNDYTRAGVYAAKRKQDDIVLDGIFAPVQTGKSGQTTVSFVADGGTSYSGKVKVGAVSRGHRNPVTTAGNYVLETGNYEGIVVSHDYVDTGSPTASGLTLPKLRALRRSMMRVEAITQDDIINLFITEEELDDLFKIDEIINADYAIRRSLAEGKVTTYMGYRFIQYTGLKKDSNGYTRCIAIASNNVAGRSAIKLARQQPLTVDMWKLSERKNIPYIYIKLGAKAVRMWGELTGEIKCA